MQTPSHALLLVKNVVHVLAPGATLLGVAVTVWGTYRLTKWYHPFKGMGFLKSVVEICALVISQKRMAAKKKAAMQWQLADAENKTDSVIGLDFVFLGFVLQGFGGLFWLIDSVVDIWCGH